jgi:hypothetical protein
MRGNQPFSASICQIFGGFQRARRFGPFAKIRLATKASSGSALRSSHQILPRGGGAEAADMAGPVTSGEFWLRVKGA